MKAICLTVAGPKAKVNVQPAKTTLKAVKDLMPDAYLKVGVIDGVLMLRMKQPKTKKSKELIVDVPLLTTLKMDQKKFLSYLDIGLQGIKDMTPYVKAIKKNPTVASYGDSGKPKCFFQCCRTVQAVVAFLKDFATVSRATYDFWHTAAQPEFCPQADNDVLRKVKEVLTKAAELDLVLKNFRKKIT